MFCYFISNVMKLINSLPSNKSKKRKKYIKLENLHTGEIMLNATKFKSALLYYDIICKHFL